MSFKDIQIKCAHCGNVRPPTKKECEHIVNAHLQDFHSRGGQARWAKLSPEEAARQRKLMVEKSKATVARKKQERLAAEAAGLPVPTPVRSRSKRGRASSSD